MREVFFPPISVCLQTRASLLHSQSHSRHSCVSATTVAAVTAAFSTHNLFDMASQLNANSFTFRRFKRATDLDIEKVREDRHENSTKVRCLLGLFHMSRRFAGGRARHSVASSTNHAWV